MASKKTPPKQQDPKLSTAKLATQGTQNNRMNGELKTDPEHGRQLMSPVKQATLLNYHLAIEDSVDPEKIWESMQQIFSDQEQQEIRNRSNKKDQMRKMLDILPSKDDTSFDRLVTALRPEYKWLAQRLEQGLTEEEARINKLGKGIKRKLALALLTVRISERQKESVLDQVTYVVETEMFQKANRVSIPDHRSAAQLDKLHKSVQQLIREDLDPVLYGAMQTTEWTTEDYEEVLNVLKTKLDQLQVFRDCYKTLNISSNAGTILPPVLRQKIDEIKNRIRILQQEKQDALDEADLQAKEKEDKVRSLSRLEQHNRSLELENRTLEEEKQYMEHLIKKFRDGNYDLDKNLQQAEEDNQKLKSQLQIQQDKISEMTLRNKSLDDHNSRLTRDNQKLLAANIKLRKDSRPTVNKTPTDLRTENKRLTEDNARLKTDIRKLEEEKRRIVIRYQTNEAENKRLKIQKIKLMEDKRKVMEQNKTLRTEAKRLALGKKSPLPAISEENETEGSSNTAEKAGDSHRPQRGERPARASRLQNRQRNKLNKIWTKSANAETGKTFMTSSDAENSQRDKTNSKQQASYMTPTASSKNRTDDGRGDNSHKRPYAWK